MSRWPEVPLGELLTPASHWVEIDAEQSYRLAGIYSFGRGLMDKGELAGSQTKYKQLRRLSGGQVVYARLNAWEGALAVVPDEFEGFHVSSEFPTFSIEPAVAPAYLAAFLSSPALWGRLAPRGSMVRRKRTPEPVFLGALMPLPPIDEQRRIAIRIARIAAHASSSNQLWTSAEEGASAAVNRLFDVAATRAQEISLSEVLEERRLVAAGDGEMVSMAGIYSYGRGLFRRPSKARLEINYPTLYRVSRHQLVMSKLFAWEGAFALCTDEFEGVVVSPEFPTFDIDEKRADPFYVRAAVCRATFYRSLAVSGMGNRRQRVNPAQLLSASIPLPSLAVQRRIAAADQLRRSAGEQIARQRTLAAALSASVVNEVFSDLR